MNRATAEEVLEAYDEAVMTRFAEDECGWNEGNCRPAMDRRLRRLRVLVLRRLKEADDA